MGDEAGEVGRATFRSLDLFCMHRETRNRDPRQGVKDVLFLSRWFPLGLSATWSQCQRCQENRIGIFPGGQSFRSHQRCPQLGLLLQDPVSYWSVNTNEDYWLEKRLTIHSSQGIFLE